MNRRHFIQSCFCFMAVSSTPWLVRPAFAQSMNDGPETIEKSAEEWKKILTPQQYHVMRERGTEAPFSSPLEKEHGKGTFCCAACSLKLFSSSTKFESGTGWPSFYEPLPNAVKTQTDNDLGVPRIEVHCRRCSGHLGHVFDDGPPPTGKRYCMNGVALKFVPVG